MRLEVAVARTLLVCTAYFCFAGGAAEAQIGALLTIDYPVTGYTYEGTPTFAGWAVSPYGSLAQVYVEIDNGPSFFANVGVYRPDVCQALGNYPGCPNVGYNYQLNTTLLANGAHTLRILAELGQGGAIQTTRTFFVSNTNAGTADNGSNGCSTGRPCIDPVPATFLGGSWIETNGSSEWTLHGQQRLPSRHWKRDRFCVCLEPRLFMSDRDVPSRRNV